MAMHHLEAVVFDAVGAVLLEVDVVVELDAEEVGDEVDETAEVVEEVVEEEEEEEEEEEVAMFLLSEGEEAEADTLVVGTVID